MTMKTLQDAEDRFRRADPEMDLVEFERLLLGEMDQSDRLAAARGIGLAVLIVCSAAILVAAAWRFCL